jgi:hypothetical protein
MAKSRRLGYEDHIARTGEKRDAFRLSVGNAEEKRLL